MEGAVMGAYQFDANDNGNEEFFLIDQERAIGLDPQWTAHPWILHAAFVSHHGPGCGGL